jgi:hypothetical protein
VNSSRWLGLIPAVLGLCGIGLGLLLLLLLLGSCRDDRGLQLLLLTVLSAAEVPPGLVVPDMLRLWRVEEEDRHGCKFAGLMLASLLHQAPLPLLFTRTAKSALQRLLQWRLPQAGLAAPLGLL